ncbi:MAG TPA: ABC transporter ATP-binding protein [Burkholderiaceae bacterium]|nr:ABC transporter ATP-binding protein [Burkholderiaceae bacterium]
MTPVLRLALPDPAGTPSLVAAGIASVAIDEADLVGPPAIRARALTKRWRGGRPALDAGVNGAGKTTLLRCLLDFVRPDSGTASIFGIDVREPRARRALAFLPERFLPSPHLSGRETLAMLAGLQDHRWSDAAIGAALDELEFPREALGRRMRDYSKGMTQKLGLAAAMLQDKPMLVLDEPMSGLDPLARRFLAGLLARRKAEGRTLVFTSHAPTDITRLADRIVLLHAGRLLFSGAPAALCDALGAADLESAFVECVARTAGDARRPQDAPPRSPSP